jgi:phage gp46-like protein
MSLTLDPDFRFGSTSARSLFEYFEICLLPRRRAKPEDDVQDKSDLGGWWGDAYPDVPGDELGSRLWTLQGRGMPIALELAPQMIDEACQCAIEDGLVTQVEHILEAVGPSVLAISLQVTLPDGKIADVLGPWYIST